MDASQSIEDNHLANSLNRRTLTLPRSEKGEYIGDAETYRVPTLFKPRLKKRNMSNVWAALKAPVSCTLPLGEFLRVKPEIWDEVARHLKDQGLLRHETRYEDQISESPSETSKHLPLNKVNGNTNKDEGNTIVPLKYEGVMSIAILDSGAGISIATQSIWEK